MATIQSSGLIRNCQHSNITCELQTVETPTHHTGNVRFTDFRCPDCGQTFYIIGPDGRVREFAGVNLSSQLPNLTDISRRAPQTSKPAPKTPVTPRTIEDVYADITKKIGGDGPGTELSLNFFRRGTVKSCQACEDLARKMNEWGSAECRERLEEIVDNVLPRAKEWLAEHHKRAKGLLDLAGAIVDVETPILKNRIRAIVVESLDAWDSRQKA